MNSSNEVNITFMICLLRFLGRLAFEDEGTLYSILDAISAKVEINCKYSFLTNFYDLVKVFQNIIFLNNIYRMKQSIVVII